MTDTQETQALTTRQEHLLRVRDNMTSNAPAPIVPRTFVEAQQFASAMASSSLVPAALRDRAPDVLMIVLAGAELGFAPIKSLGLYHVIEGVPKLSADGLAALCMASPLCEYLEFTEFSAERCTYVGKRAGRPERSVTWAKDDAARANVWGKRNWATYPAQMLAARAKAILCRLLWPDVVAGLLSAEEAEDIAAEAQARAAASPQSFTAPAPIVATAVPTPAAGAPSPAAGKNAARGAAAKNANPATVSNSPTTIVAQPSGSIASAGPSGATMTSTTSAAAASAEVAPAPDPTPSSSESPSSSASVPANSAPAAMSSPSTTAPASSSAGAAAASAAAPDHRHPRDVGDGDDFGGDEPAASGLTFAGFLADVSAAKTAEQLSAVKAKYVDWSRKGANGAPDAPGAQYAPQMREAFAKAKAEIVGDAKS